MELLPTHHNIHISDKVDVDYLLEGRNCDGEIYRCDMKRFFGFDLRKDYLEKIRSTLIGAIKCHL